MVTTTNNLGAISALKGYRVQFLYTLYRILTYNESEFEFHPEGIFEDLDIYNQEKSVVEIVQIKHLGKQLTLSDIVTTKKENAFLKRAIKAYNEGSCPVIKLVSFGEVNDDIKNLSNSSYSQDLIKKLNKQGLSQKDIEVLKGNFEYEVVCEQEIRNLILSSLEAWGYLTDADSTLDLLIYWIYYSAEKQTIILPKTFKTQFDKICKYQLERIAFNKTFNSIIQPLDNNLKEENIEHLKQDFYKGISATYKHVLANVDVVRNDKLNLIREGFNDANIVFIHGASGQGKSTISYRFLKENCAETTVYELKHLPEDLTTIYDVINSLEGISKGIRFPITIYIDVEPGHKEWINILKELASKKNFNFLITIREEEWNSIEVGDKFNFSEIELSFEQEEAELIYNALDDYNKDLKFINFENAWDIFGGNGPLLEFVYLITQNESLSARLNSQIKKIRSDSSDLGKEKIRLLRYIVLADCYGSKVKLKELNDFLQLKNEILSLIDLLQKEYLIKISGDKSHIIGLHPVRSRIIKKLLFDNEIYKESDFILDELSFITDNTILVFLRNAFKNGGLSPDILIERLNIAEPHSWQMYFQIFKGLVWKGIFDYTKKNLGVLNEIYSDYGKGWITVVNFDLANVIEGGSMMENADFFTEEQRQYAKSMNQKLSDKNDVFSYCLNWLSNLTSIDIIPRGKDEWNSFGLFLFWLNHFNYNSIKIKLNEFEFEDDLGAQSLEAIAHVLYALNKYNNQTIEYIDRVEKIFLKKLSEQYNIISIEKKDVNISCYYLFDIMDEDVETEESDIIHAKSMQIIDLLRFAFPDKEHYNTKGVGHQFSFLPSNFDSSIKEIPRKNLPLKPLVEINSTYINLFNYTQRPKNWSEYVELIKYRRLLLCQILNKLVFSFKEFHKQKKFEILRLYIIYYFEKRNELKISPLLPQNITDEWGEFGENGVKDKVTKPAISFQRYKTFEKTHNDFISSIENFLWQSANVIISKLKFKTEHAEFDSNTARVSLVGNLFKAFELINEYQEEFRVHFEKFIEPATLKKLETTEIDNISILSVLYRQFIYSDSFISGNVNKIALNRLKDIELNIKKKISSGLRQLANELEVEIKVGFDEKKHRCVIFVDYRNTIETFQLLELIYNGLFEIIGQPEYTSIKYLQLNTKFPIFNIALLVSGKTINSTWYEFKTYNLREKRIEELEQFNLLPQKIPLAFIEKYAIKSWNNELDEFEQLDKLLESTSMAYQLAFHFSQLKYFEGKTVENYNKGIFEKYVVKTVSLFQENLQKSIDLFCIYAEYCNEEKIEFVDEKEKHEFYELLLDNHKYFYPNDTLFERGEMKFILGFEDVSEWIPRLEKLVNNVHVIYYFIAGKVIKKSINN